MTQKIQCYTLFDITQTGVPNRHKPGDDAEFNVWFYKRNTQANFDTVLQAISLRSQPENISSPTKISIRFEEFSNFGFLYQEDEEIPCWTFNFEVQHPSVFEDGINDLGFLYADCDEVPMIKCNTEWSKLSNQLNTTPECRNIYFVKIP